MLKPTPRAISSWMPQFDDLPLSFTEKLSHLRPAMERASDAAIWTRPLPLSVEDWLNDIPAKNLPDGRYILRPSEAAACVETLFAARGLVATPALTWLSKDAERLAHSVCDVAGTEKVRLRLETVDDNACSRLHIDNVVARMICTYRGPGTQLGLDTSAPDDIQTVPTGMPVLLKGKLWPGECAPELRHRSPPIEGTGITRLVLVLEGVSPEDIMPAYDTLYA